MYIIFVSISVQFHYQKITFDGVKEMHGILNNHTDERTLISGLRGEVACYCMKTLNWNTAGFWHKQTATASNSRFTRDV